ncbi:N-acetylmuramoyl-L-alanine amidase family protein [Nafulsella turpanensis]|uniref:N-acetylmuramoyl-L-alanine amidase family protein n=1 Tax=Nafulsella turpanensis TaxID=1265690 RepID=UPI0003496267|nr:N-acetylmuramoyl-L-alanine amidase [Nafulsella turpanensis]
MNFFKYFFLFILLFSSPSLFAQTDSTAVRAKEGEGVYSLLRRFGLNPAEHLQAFLELNKERLGEGNSLLLHKSYSLPVATTSATVPEAEAGDSVAGAGVPVVAEVPAVEIKKEASVLNIPLFGKNNARVEVKDQQLKGAVYYLLSGHGGPDPGAIGQYGPYQLSEDEYAYDVTIRLARRLMEHGAMVYMIVQDENDGIRDGSILEADRDETDISGAPIPYDHNERLRQRVSSINRLYLQHKGDYQRMVAIHVDSRRRNQNVDVFFYHHRNSPSGKALAERIQDRFITNYARHQPDRPYDGDVSERSGLYVIRYSHPPTVFIELGNIGNQRDQRRFVLAENRQALANWIFEGILGQYKAEQQ